MLIKDRSYFRAARLLVKPSEEVGPHCMFVWKFTQLFIISLWNPSAPFKAARTESHQKCSRQREWGYCRYSEISGNTRITNDIQRGIMSTRTGKPKLVLSFSLSLSYFCPLGAFFLLTASSARSSFMGLQIGSKRNPVPLIYFCEAKGHWLLWEATSGTMRYAGRGNVCTSFIQSWIYKFLPLPNLPSKGSNSILLGVVGTYWRLYRSARFEDRCFNTIHHISEKYPVNTTYFTLFNTTVTLDCFGYQIKSTILSWARLYSYSKLKRNFFKRNWICESDSFIGRNIALSKPSDAEK